MSLIFMKKLYGRYTVHKILHLKITQRIRKAASASMRVLVYNLTHMGILFPDYPRIGRIIL